MNRYFARFACFVLILALFGATPKPVPALQPLLVQLAQNPDNADLRREIIQLVLEMPHPPPPSPKFEEEIGAAGYAFKHAASPADFQASIAAFKKASLLAPWVSNVYYNIALADEKVQAFDDAIANFNWYLTAAPHAKDAADVYQKIGALQFQKQRKTTVDAQASVAAQASAAAQVAAAQAVERKRAVISALRQATYGASYQVSWCSATHQDGVGCNFAEFRGNNWYQLAGGIVTFGFPDPDTAVIYAPRNGIDSPFLRLTASSSGAISVECSAITTLFIRGAYPTGAVQRTDWTTFTPAWITSPTNWSGFTVSCDRNPFDNTDSVTRHYYWWFHKVSG